MGFSVRDVYPLGTANNTCYICRAAQRDLNGRTESVIDSGLSVDFEGLLMFCESCVREMGNLVDMLDPEKTAELRAIAIEALDTNKALLAEKEDLLNKISTLKSLLTVEAG